MARPPAKKPKPAAPPKPTIEDVLARFLADQEPTHSAKTHATYRSVLELFQHSLNGYGHQNLDAKETKAFERLYNAKGEAHREFCQIFGPEHILPNVGEFLGYFMVRKVMCGKDLLRAAGTVTQKLAHWLEEHGHVDAHGAEEAVDQGGAAARDLPIAAELADALHSHAENQPWGEPSEQIEGHFTVTLVGPKSLWLTLVERNQKYGPIALPPDLIAACKVGWTITGLVARVGRKWVLYEAWNVYPA